LAFTGQVAATQICHAVSSIESPISLGTAHGFSLDPPASSAWARVPAAPNAAKASAAAIATAKRVMRFPPFLIEFKVYPRIAAPSNSTAS
jgi:hypothetical protein